MSVDLSAPWRAESKEIALALKENELMAIELIDVTQLDKVRADEDRANMLADQLIEAAGFDTSDSDMRGDQMAYAVRDALIFVILRLGTDAVMEGWL